MPRIIITEPGKTPQPYRLKTDRIATKIGRGSDNDIIITAPSASTYHCKMKRVEGGFILVDNDSTNGIKYEDTRYTIIDLKDGMTVKIGDDIDMEFTLSDEEKEILAEEDFEPQQRACFPKPKKKPAPKEEAPKKEETDVEEDHEDAVILQEAKPKPKKQSSDKNTDESDSKPKLKVASDKPIQAVAAPVAIKSANSGMSFIIFIIFALLFFGAGMALRHYQDHKTFIFSK
jgi:pSer/pThr/pTyr-binding forkhead associated (FHA) protein